MPKTYNNLFEKIITFENLYLAYIKARRNKRYLSEVLGFSCRIEEELIEIQKKLIEGTYKTGKYFKFVIYEPKKREIAALPFRDRVVHHALCNIIEPLFEKKFIYDSYGCRVDKGTHAGANRVLKFLRCANRNYGQVYCLKGDIEKFFPSINHNILKNIIRRTIRCKKTLWLIDEIINSVPGEKGMPIGNLTSQLFANVYLNELDHFIKKNLKIRFYVRYMDDFVILHNSKSQLHDWQGNISNFLENKLDLKLNRKTSIFPISRGIDFLGYRTWPTHRLLRKRSIINMKRKLKELSILYSIGKIEFDRIRCIIASWVGHAKHANSYNIRKKVLCSVVFKRNNYGGII